MSKSGAKTAWENVREGLLSELGQATFDNWFAQLGFSDLDGERVRLTAPTRFLRDWVRNHYSQQLLHFWQLENPAIQSLDIDVASGNRQNKAEPSAAEAPANSAPVNNNTATAPTGQAGEKRLQITMPGTPAADGGERYGGIGSPLDPRYRFDTFVVGKSNELAYAAARRVAEQTEVKFNPLFLHGGVGLGKTHLMHAIAWHVREAAIPRRVIYLSAEKFMYQFIRALRERDAMSFKETFRNVDVLMIDDVQFFSRKDSTQEEFFHTFNALMDQNKQIVISADCSPSDLEDVEERVRSRLGWGLVADIHQTDFELRLGILQAKLREQDDVMDGKVLEFMAHRINSNVRELEGALNRVMAYSNLVGRPVSIEMAQEVLQDLLRANDRRITIEDIQKKVAAHYNIRLADMHSARRSRAVARPRQVAMYLSKALTTRSLPEIGRKFGGRDHTTVMHAVKRIEELALSEASLSEDLELLKRTLEG